MSCKVSDHIQAGPRRTPVGFENIYLVDPIELKFRMGLRQIKGKGIKIKTRN